MMSPPLKIAAGASTVGAVCVVSILTFAARDTETAPLDVVKTETAVVQTEEVAATDAPQNDVEPEAATAGPRFDLVRVDASGGAVIAGLAEPNAEVGVVLGNDQIVTVEADNNGAFVALFQLPSGEAAQTVGLQQLREGAVVAVSAQTVLVVPPALSEAEPVAPTLVLADETGAEILQGGAQSALADLASNPLSLDTITYDTGGAVVLSGQGQGAQYVRIYVDNQPVQTELVPDDGKWRVVLPDVDQGLFTLRVDEINEQGSVSARVESPFQRVAPADLDKNGVTASDQTRVIVQPGGSLWELAEQTYGDGVKYVQIFNANRDTIRDANLIYPGQVFKLPD